MKKTYHLFLLCIIFALFSSSCTPETIDKVDCATFHWGYDNDNGPAVWSECESGCAGTSQSPIDIVGAVNDGNLSALQTSYHATPIDLIHNGHAIELEYHTGSTLDLNGKTYTLLQAHFHGGSEHTVDGHRRPLEVHLVHKASDNDLAVIGIFIKEGASNAFLANFIDHLPTTEGTTYEDAATVDITNFLPASQSYYTYSGSLTTPPCSEVVTWLVMKDPVEASTSQIGKITSILQTTYRPTLPLNGRVIKSFQ
jgi:carbonic anhydrase